MLILFSPFTLEKTSGISRLSQGHCLCLCSHKSNISCFTLHKNKQSVVWYRPTTVSVTGTWRGHRWLNRRIGYWATWCLSACCNNYRLKTKSSISESSGEISDQSKSTSVVSRSNIVIIVSRMEYTPYERSSGVLADFWARHNATSSVVLWARRHTSSSNTG